MLRAPSPFALAASLTFSIGFLVGCTTARGPSEIDKELARAKRDANKRKPAECFPDSQEPCYAAGDGVEGADGTAGRGVCKEGVRQCDGEGFWQACKDAVLPAAETCNEIDDDCNGKVDDGFERAGTICFAGEGECKAEGKVACSADGSASVCSAAAKAPHNEICDGKDNDCDGTVDEGALEGTGAECKTGEPGACSTGLKQCVAGTIKCMASHARTVEICANKVDEDCDSKVDEEGCITEADAREAGIIK